MLDTNNIVVSNLDNYNTLYKVELNFDANEQVTYGTQNHQCFITHCREPSDT